MYVLGDEEGKKRRKKKGPAEESIPFDFGAAADTSQGVLIDDGVAIAPKVQLFRGGDETVLYPRYCIKKILGTGNYMPRREQVALGPLKPSWFKNQVKPETRAL